MTLSNRKPKLQTYVDVKTRNVPTLMTGNDKIDNFTSNKGGFVIGSCIFFTGTSGAGKTTFAVLLQKMFANFVTALYSREMEACDVKEQTERLGIDHRNALIADKSDCKNIDEFIRAIDEEKPKVVIVDSLQVLMKEDCTEGKTEQELWDLISKLRDWTSKNNAVLFVIGHVTKKGEFEGPNTIKQMFDAHMHMDFDQKKNERTLSWTKNRKGSTTISLYYEFANNDMVFYTEEEWNSKAGVGTLMEKTQGLMQGFLDTLNPNHAEYDSFHKELEIEMGNLDEDMNENVMIVKVMVMINTLSIKHNLIAD